MFTIDNFFLLFFTAVILIAFWGLYRGKVFFVSEIHHDWDKEESDLNDWVQIDYNGEQYPFRRRELKNWYALSRNEKRDYIAELNKLLKSGKIKIVTDPVYGKMIVTTDKGRDIKFRVFDFYKVKK